MLGRIAALAVVAAAAAPDAPSRWVTDPAGFLSTAVRAQLDARLEAHQRATGQQVVVWISGSTGGEPIEDFAARAFRAWAVGRKGFDDGAVLFVMADDRRARIEVGYGLEERLPDALASRLLTETFVPALKAGQHDAAVTATVDGILARLQGGPAPPVEQPALPTLSWPQKIALLAAGVALLVFAIVNPRAFFQLLWFVMLFGRGGRRKGGGGGFSGQGGRSGGGGASSSW